MRESTIGLPMADPALIAVAHLVRVLEQRCPGVMEDWLRSFDDRDFRPELIAVSSGTPADFLSGEEAAHWARLLKLMTYQMLGAPNGRRRRK